MQTRSWLRTMGACTVSVGAAWATQVAPSAGAEKPLRTKLPSGKTTVPMQIHEAQPVVEVTINDRGPYRFLVDTGAAGGGRVSSRLADELGLEIIDEVQAGDPSGRSETIARVGVNSLGIGEARFSGLAMLRRDGGLFGDSLKDDIVGIVGFGVFAECLLSLDYPAGQLTIEAGELPGADGGQVFEFRSPGGIPEVTLEVAGEKVDADIDSGSMGSLTIPRAVADRLKFSRPPVVVGRASTGFSSFDIVEAPLEGDVHWGGQTLSNPVVAINEVFPRGNIGGGVLRHFALTFDQKNQRVRITSPAAGPIVAGPRYRVGVMLRHLPDAVMVDGVVPGSAAEAAGLMKGDRIVTVNGTAALKTGSRGMGEVFSKPDPVTITIERDSKEMTLTVTPRRADQ